MRPSFVVWTWRKWCLRWKPSTQPPASLRAAPQRGIAAPQTWEVLHRDPRGRSCLGHVWSLRRGQSCSSPELTNQQTSPVVSPGRPWTALAGEFIAKHRIRNEGRETGKEDRQQAEQTDAQRPGLRPEWGSFMGTLRLAAGPSSGGGGHVSWRWASWACSQGVEPPLLVV